MHQIFSLLFVLFFCTGYCQENISGNEMLSPAQNNLLPPEFTLFDTTIITGAEQMQVYLPIIKNKYVGLVVNQTSVVHQTHLVDTLLKLGVKISLIFAPEHGFRGTEDAGAAISNAKDARTGISVLSIYGNKKKPAAGDLQDIDVLIFDILDAGARFYTYISTLHYVMEACAENKKPLIILDRPNPNGFYVDGPVLHNGFQSFVGMHPVPVVHGMTIGEYAQMINGEYWLPDSLQCDIQIIPCVQYDHTDFYEVKIPPSPNLKTMRAIYLYPSLCLFEGTNVSVGRGTDKPFEVFGSPDIAKTEFNFIPQSGPGAKVPVFMNEICYGYDLSQLDVSTLREQQLTLIYLINVYNLFHDKGEFFLTNNFFNKLAGNDVLIKQIQAGLTEDEIRLTWQQDLLSFKQVRKKYLLYPDFE
ncbi:MAG: DUF1343 domain-containing protein [Chitinophagales bacterium]|nr:DUF1343 domain-containing protein [Chitinophagales bacterium]